MRCGRTNRGRSGYPAVVLICVGLFLAARGLEFPAAIVAAIAAGKIFQWWRDPARPIHSAILHDAREHGVAVPDDEVVWDAFYKLYAKYARTSRTYSQLSGQYAEVIDAMWLTLHGTHDLREWRRIVGSVGIEWPTPFADGESPLRSSLSKAQVAVRKWQEAHDEVHQWS